MPRAFIPGPGWSFELLVAAFGILLIGIAFCCHPSVTTRPLD